jgi:recombination protein RecT
MMTTEAKTPADTTTPAKPQKAETPMQVLRGQFEGAMRAEIAKALPKDIDPDRFIRTVITSVQMNPNLMNADRRSLIAACMKAAQDGLMPDGREAVLNIYSTKIKDNGQEFWVDMVQFLPMVRGLLKAMRNSGEVANVDAAAVYEKDHFVFKRGDDPKIEHEPYMGADDPGPVIAAYVIVKLLNGEVHREVMSKRDIEKVRGASKAANGPGWTQWYDQFAIKSAIKRSVKLLPSSSDRLNQVIDHDNDAMGFEFNQRGVDATQVIAATPPRPAIEAGRSSRLASIVGTTGAVTDAPQQTTGEVVGAEGGAE